MLFRSYDKDDKFVGSVSLAIFSKEENVSITDWANRDLKRNAKQTNPYLFQYSELKEMQLGTQNAVYYSCDSKLNNDKDSYIGNDIFWEYGDYIYNMHIEMEKDKEHMINTILQTLEFDTIDYSKVGILSLDKWMEDEDAVVSTKKNAINKYTINIPSSWSSNEDNSSFTDNKKGIEVAILKLNYAADKQVIQEFVDDLKKNSSNTIVKNVTPFRFGRASCRERV